MCNFRKCTNIIPQQIDNTILKYCILYFFSNSAKYFNLDVFHIHGLHMFYRSFHFFGFNFFFQFRLFCFWQKLSTFSALYTVSTVIDEKTIYRGSQQRHRHFEQLIHHPAQQLPRAYSRQKCKLSKTRSSGSFGCNAQMPITVANLCAKKKGIKIETI